MPDVDICVCTYRRARLAGTLASLARIEVPDRLRVSIIVADNDHEPSARGVVDKFAAEAPFPVKYIHCPAANVSLARNAGLEAGSARYFAFIDDDETAAPEWLSRLWTKMKSTNATAVFGPVIAVYDRDVPAWMPAADFHSTRPVWTRGEIMTGYTGNVLIDRSDPRIRHLRFPLSHGCSGGEDTAYFSEAYELGARFAYAPEAVVTEPVPADRATFGWLANRRFRMGMTYGAALAEDRGLLPRTVEAAKALAKFVVFVGLSVVQLPYRLGRNKTFLRGLLHAGTVLGLFGISLRGHAPPAASNSAHRGTKQQSGQGA